MALLDVDVLVALIRGHRQITDAHLSTLARRAGQRLATSDHALGELGGSDVHLLTALS